MKLLFSSTLLLSIAIQAQDSTQVVDSRPAQDSTNSLESNSNITRQRRLERIEQGAASGQLNERQKNRLLLKDQEIVNTRKGMLTDGKIDDKEKAYLHKLRIQQSRRIYNKKHDDVVDKSLLKGRDKRMYRIEQGVNSGALTNQQTKRLLLKEEEIKNTRKGMLTDGVINQSEKEYLKNLRERQSRRIYNKKHDDVQAGSQSVPESEIQTGMAASEPAIGDPTIVSEPAPEVVVTTSHSE